MGRKEFEGPATFLRKLKNTREGEQLWKWIKNHGRGHSRLGEFAPCSINTKAVSGNHSGICVWTFLVLCCIYYFGIWCHDPMLWIGAAWSQPYVDSISCLIPALCGLVFMLSLNFMLSQFDACTQSSICPNFHGWSQSWVVMISWMDRLSIYVDSQ